MNQFGPTIYLATTFQQDIGMNHLCPEIRRKAPGQPPMEEYCLDRLPSILISYAYVQNYIRRKKKGAKFWFRDWCLDSGAFSAFNCGKQIDLDEYIRTCKFLFESDDKLKECFSLDVIPVSIEDYKKTWIRGLKNTEKMWENGIKAIPTYHIGEPECALLEMAKTYPKIAIGGMTQCSSRSKKSRFIEQCFSRVWPKKIHGLGLGDGNLILKFPFHSVDATTWSIGPAGFARWKKYGNLSWRGASINIKSQLEWFLDLEEKSRAIWGSEMSNLDKADV